MLELVAAEEKLYKHASIPQFLLNEAKNMTLLCSPRGGAGKYSKRAPASPRRLQAQDMKEGKWAWLKRLTSELGTKQEPVR